MLREYWDLVRASFDFWENHRIPYMCKDFDFYESLRLGAAHFSTDKYPKDVGVSDLLKPLPCSHLRTLEQILLLCLRLPRGWSRATTKPRAKRMGSRGGTRSIGRCGRLACSFSAERTPAAAPWSESMSLMALPTTKFSSLLTPLSVVAIAFTFTFTCISCRIYCCLQVLRFGFGNGVPVPCNMLLGGGTAIRMLMEGIPFEVWWTQLKLLMSEWFGDDPCGNLFPRGQVRDQEFTLKVVESSLEWIMCCCRIQWILRSQNGWHVIADLEFCCLMPYSHGLVICSTS